MLEGTIERSSKRLFDAELRKNIKKLLPYIARSCQEGKTIASYSQLSQVPRMWLSKNMRRVRDVLLRVDVPMWERRKGKVFRYGLSSKNAFGVPYGKEEVEEWCRDVMAELEEYGFRK